MNYLIKAAYQEGKQLTPAQRTSSFFSSEPRVGIHVLRRGITVRFTDEQMKAHDLELRRLLSAEAITVTPEGVTDQETPPVPPEETAKVQASLDAQAAAAKRAADEAASKAEEERLGVELKAKLDEQEKVALEEAQKAIEESGLPTPVPAPAGEAGEALKTVKAQKKHR